MLVREIYVSVPRQPAYLVVRTIVCQNDLSAVFLSSRTISVESARGCVSISALSKHLYDDGAPDYLFIALDHCPDQWPVLPNQHWSSKGPK